MPAPCWKRPGRASRWCWSTGCMMALMWISFPWTTSRPSRLAAGIKFEEVKTGKYATMLNSWDKPLTEEEKAIMQQYVNETYQTFIKRVTDGRKIPTAKVDSIGQGRVWTGEQAVALGLVDKIGNIKDAIRAA